MNHTLWVEKYRPDNLENYISSDSLKNKLQSFINTQDIPHLLFYGGAGTGKTTAAKILVKHIDCDYIFINASDENSVDVIRNKIKNFASTIGFKELKIIVLDEADYVTPQAQAALRNLMETFSKTTRFILTCNFIERIIDPIVSRAQTFELTPPSKKQVALQLARILHEEQIEFTNQDVVTLVTAYYPDVRRVINIAQQSVIDGKMVINVDNLIASDIKLKILDILVSNVHATQKVKEVRQIIANEGVRDFLPLYQLLYEKVEDIAGDKQWEAIRYIAEGMYRDASVPDKEITFVATLVNVLC
jgi:replication-associated recombination protein RarA